MSITIEQRLVSDQLRRLLPSVVDGSATPDEVERGTQLVNALAGGDAFTAARAWLRFSGRLTRREPVAEALLQLFYSGDLDLVGVRDNDLVWVATTTSGDSN